MTSPNPRPNMTYVWKGFPPPLNGWRYERATMERLDAEGRIHYPMNPDGSLDTARRPALKRYLEEQQGTIVTNVWTDIESLHAGAGERLGYPTQKPEALLERIIKASSNEGDVVLDPFCGCGTAVVAAHRLNRSWVGIDVTYLAVDLMKNRLLTTFPGDFKNGIHIDGEPADEAAALALAERDKYQFQFWAVAKLGGTSRGGENKKGADRGIDGVVGFRDLDPAKSGKDAVAYRQVIISVKGGATGPSHVRDLIGTVEREQAAIGVLVTAHRPTAAMEKDAAESGTYKDGWGNSYPKIQIITAADIVHGKRIDMPDQRGVAQYQAAPRAKRGTQARLGE